MAPTYQTERTELGGEGGGRADLASDGLQYDNLLFTGSRRRSHFKTLIETIALFFYY
jgi:hypothetical protein